MIVIFEVKRMNQSIRKRGMSEKRTSDRHIHMDDWRRGTCKEA